MIKKELLEPIERLIQLTDDMRLLGEIQDKLLSSETSNTPIEQVQLATIESINHLSGIIKTLSGEIINELKIWLK